MNHKLALLAPIALGLLGAPIGVAVSAPAPARADLLAPERFDSIADRRARSVALFNEMGKVIQSPRCLNCHPRGDKPTQHDGVPHSPQVSRGGGNGVLGLQCTTCHGPANVTFENGRGSIPGNPAWLLAPREMAWAGKSLGAICAQVKDSKRNGGRSLADLLKHNATDGLVGWGWAAGVGRRPAPGTQQRFGELTKAWIDTGAVCPKG
jgi:hypothetical protein